MNVRSNFAGPFGQLNPIGLLLHIMGKRIAELLAHRALRAAEAHLYALDDRTLKDIGLHRSEIRSTLIELRTVAQSDGPLFVSERSSSS